MKRFFNNIVVKFILITLVFFIITSPIVVLFGPFGNLKRAVVGAIMRSRHPQYITWLYDQEELNQILGTVTTTDKQNVFAFKPRTDATLKLKKIETSRFVGYLLEIPNPKRIEVATAEDINEKGDTTSSIAKKNNAVAAINGGGFYDPNGTGIGRLPYGFILHQGKYLLGQQVDDKEKVDFVGMTKNGNLIAGNYNKKELRDLGAVEGLTFGPPLIINGQKVIKSGDGGWGISPRSAIDQKLDEFRQYAETVRRRMARCSSSSSMDDSPATASVLRLSIRRISSMKTGPTSRPIWTADLPRHFTIMARWSISLPIFWANV